jgi:hypothetical protein
VVAVLAISGHYHSLLVATDGFARQAFVRSTETDEGTLRVWLDSTCAVSDRWCASCGQKLRLLSFDSKSTVCLVCITGALLLLITYRFRSLCACSSLCGVVVVLVCRGSSTGNSAADTRKHCRNCFNCSSKTLHTQPRVTNQVCYTALFLLCSCWSNAGQAATIDEQKPATQESYTVNHHSYTWRIEFLHRGITKGDAA